MPATCGLTSSAWPSASEVAICPKETLHDVEPVVMSGFSEGSHGMSGVSMRDVSPVLSCAVSATGSAGSTGSTTTGSSFSIAVSGPSWGRSEVPPSEGEPSGSASGPPVSPTAGAEGSAASVSRRPSVSEGSSATGEASSGAGPAWLDWASGAGASCISAAAAIAGKGAWTTRPSATAHEARASRFLRL